MSPLDKGAPFSWISARRRDTVDEAITMTPETVGIYVEDLQEKGEEVPTKEELLECALTGVVPE